jgi:hypothetical protein
VGCAQPDGRELSLSQVLRLFQLPVVLVLKSPTAWPEDAAEKRKSKSRLIPVCLNNGNFELRYFIQEDLDLYRKNPESTVAVVRTIRIRYILIFTKNIANAG